jgi:decaprenylphospho-beta-D-ribofuranose 2-oxidase
MRLSGWGRYPVIEAERATHGTRAALTEYLSKPGDFIVYAKGRSYGDSALSRRVLFSERFNMMLDFRPDQGILTCECGVTLAEIIDFALSRGWFLATVPGTKLISLGGAIASDVHGKNHHKAGCFSNGVLSLNLMLPDGKVAECSRETNPDLFFATCGGMGLTGIILSATVKLQCVKSRFIKEQVVCCQNLREVFAAFEENQRVTYSVAWVDCLAKGDRLGRSVLMAGEHAESGGREPARERTYAIPCEMPAFFLNRYSVAVFNELYYRLQASAKHERLCSFDGFFFPLDKIKNWNRMYGPKGFTQYQFVLPKDASFAGLRAVLSKTSEAGLGSFLGVLKLLGPANQNMLSFPTEGYTLALDFKVTDRLLGFLSELDRIVIDHGGRINLCKDARMSPEMFKKGYTRWKEFVDLRTKYGMRNKLNSLQSLRLGI